jgi:thioredoxin reductase (NADPH)
MMYEGFLAGGVAAGGQLTTTTDVENYPGFPVGITGSELMEQLRKQSERFGTTIITETITKCDLSKRPFKFWREGDEESVEPTVTADSLIIATGATAKRMHLPGEDVYWQCGISACAVCDGAAPIYRNKVIAVVGGGDSACEESVFLTKFASKVYMLVRRDKMRASKVMAERAVNNPKIEVLWNHVPVEVKGDGKLMNQLVIEDTTTKVRRTLECRGLFYAIGHKPNTDVFKGKVKLDEDGYVIVKPGTTFTNIEGVFAAGDVQDKRYRQAITAAGSGCMAALDCERWLEAHE